METTTLKVSEIHPSPDNIRHQIGRLKELKQSIESVGLLQPIVVVENTEGYAIVAGHRRFAAVKELGWEEVPVVVHEFEDAEKLEAMIVENFHREDLSPIEQAEGLFALEGLGLNRKVIAEKTGLSAKLVRERIKLLDLPKSGQEMIHQGRLSLEAGLELAGMATDPELVEEVLAHLESGRADLRWALGDARRQKQARELEAKLAAKLDRLRELGAEVVEAEERNTGYYGNHFAEAPRGWQLVVGAEAVSWQDGLHLDEKAHAKEECAVWYWKPAWQGYEPSLRQFCKKPARHTFTGASELKIADAETIHAEREKSRKSKAKDREKRAHIDARYRAALAGKKPGRDLAFQLAWRGFLGDVWAEHIKRAAQLLDLEPAEAAHSGKDWEKPLREFGEKNPEKVALALVIAKADPLDGGVPNWSPLAPVKADLLAAIPEVE